MANKLMDEATGRYLPVIYPEEKPFWEAAKGRKLVLQCCDDCSKVWYPIGPTCPFCLSSEFTWKEMSGRGVVSSYVIFHKAWTKYYESRVPYAVVQVEIEEGPRLTTNLLGMSPHDIRVGLPVKVDYEDLTDEITLVQFRPEE